MSDFSEILLQWHQVHGRKGLPWQNQKDPYQVWLSEIMLQQTQVVTVQERYSIFLQKFPQIQALAAAPLDDVMALWAGLGYYSRARNLHNCAQIIVGNYAGKFPEDALHLMTLPGIGLSTAAAIAAFCYGQRISILDANVKRLLARKYGILGDVKKGAVHQELWTLAQSVLPSEAQQMPSYTQALMDFGATVCKPKKPHCTHCVFKSTCFALTHDRVMEIPLQVKKVKTTIVQSEMLLLIVGQSFLLELKPHQGIWGGLWSLPESPWVMTTEKPSKTFTVSLSDFASLPTQLLQEPYRKVKRLVPRKHVFTHRTLYFQIGIVHLTEKFEVDPQRFKWVVFDDCAHLGLPAPIRQLLNDDGGDQSLFKKD